MVKISSEEESDDKKNQVDAKRRKSVSAITGVSPSGDGQQAGAFLRRSGIGCE